MKRRKAFDREMRLIQIVNAVAKQEPDIRSVVFTASFVANELDISTVQARTLIGHLINQNVVWSKEEPYPGVCGKRIVYAFTPEYIQDCEEKRLTAKPQSRRTIKVNGQQMGFEVQ